MNELTSRYLRICLLLLAICAGAVVLSGKTNAEQGKQQSQLKMSLSSSTLMLCLGSSLPLGLELTNQGSEEVKIDKVDLWNRFSYSLSRTDGSGRGGGRGSSCDHCRGNYVVLQPGGRYESSFDYPMDDFFKDAGKYTIKMMYEDISTNELSFELYDCNPQ